jgi:hypothetical protein
MGYARTLASTTYVFVNELGDRLWLVVEVLLVRQLVVDLLDRDIEHLGQTQQYALGATALDQLLLIDPHLEALTVRDQGCGLRRIRLLLRELVRGPDLAAQGIGLGGAHAVVLGFLGVDLGGQHLQEPQARGQRGEHDRHQDREHLQSGRGPFHLRTAPPSSVSSLR